MKYVQTKSYDKAKEIAETIDWKRVKNASMLCTVSEIYEYTGEYQKSREILFIAYDRSPGEQEDCIPTGNAGTPAGGDGRGAGLLRGVCEYGPERSKSVHIKI